MSVSALTDRSSAKNPSHARINDAMQRSKRYKEVRNPGLVKPDISLIIVNYRTRQKVEQLFDSLTTSPPSVSWEAVIIDVCPDAEDYDIRLPDNNSIRVVRLQHNSGFGAAVNYAIPFCSGRYLMPMNSDLIHTGDAIGILVRHLDGNTDIGIVAPWLLNIDGSPQFNARKFYSWVAIVCRRTPLGRLLPNIVKDHLNSKTSGKQTPFASDWLTGACLAVRRDLLQNNSQLYDERYFLYFEDVDLCARVQLEGWNIECHPQSRFVHQHARKSRKPWSREGRAHLISMVKFWLKYHSLSPDINVNKTVTATTTVTSAITPSSILRQPHHASTPFSVDDDK